MWLWRCCQSLDRDLHAAAAQLQAMAMIAAMGQWQCAMQGQGMAQPHATKLLKPNPHRAQSDQSVCGPLRFQLHKPDRHVAAHAAHAAACSKHRIGSAPQQIPIRSACGESHATLATFCFFDHPARPPVWQSHVVPGIPRTQGGCMSPPVLARL